jgi:hypothetical protein
MTKLRTLKNCNALREFTDLRPKLSCKTRWSGTFIMLGRFFELMDPINKLIATEFDETIVLPIRSVQASIKELYVKLKGLNSVMLELQKPNINLHSVRVLFDYTITEYPTMSYYLKERADIVFSPDFEAAVVKLLKEVDFISYFYGFYDFYLILQEELSPEEEMAAKRMKNVQPWRYLILSISFFKWSGFSFCFDLSLLVLY